MRNTRLEPAITASGSDFDAARQPLADRSTIAVGGGDRRKRAAVMDGRAEPLERREMLGHAVALVALEAVAGMRSPSRIISRSRVTLATIEAAAIEAPARRR